MKNGNGEIVKTSLLVIAGLFTATGGATLTTDLVSGSILLFFAVGVLVLRGYLKIKKII